MSAISIILVVLLLAAVLITIISIIAYNRRLDKVTSGEVRDAHSSILEPSTAVGATYRIVLMVIVILSLISIGTLNGMVTNLQNMISNLQSRQQALYYEMEDLKSQLREQESRISDFSFGIRSVDYEKGTAEIYFSVGLKEFSDDAEITMQLGTVETVLTPSSKGLFTGTASVGIFEYFEQGSLIIHENGTDYSETTDFPETIVYEIFPMPMMNCNFSSSYSKGKLGYSGEYIYEFEHPEEVETVLVTYMTGNKDLKTVDVTDSCLNHEMISVDQGLDLDSDLTFHTEVKLKNGYTIVDRSVMIYDAEYSYTEYERILDPNGNVCWENTYKE